MRPFEAALKGAKQIGFTIVSITVSLLAVFIPILLMGGIVGRLFREFAVTLSIAIAVSAVISLTLTPMMCSRLLEARATGAHGRLYKLSERVFEGMRRHLRRAGCAGCSATSRSCCASRSPRSGSPSPLHHRPEGALPAAGHGHDDGHLRTRRRTSRSPSMNGTAGGRQRGGPGGPGRGEHASRSSAADAGTRAPCFIELKPKPPREPHRRPDHRPPAPQARQDRGDHALPAVGAGRARRRAPRADAVPVHARGREPRRAQHLGAARCSTTLKKLPELKDVATDQQTDGLELDVDIDRDTASRLGILAPEHRRHALRRLRAAPGRDDLHPAQPVPRRPRGEARATQRSPTPSTSSTWPSAERRPGAAHDASPRSRPR